MATFQEHLSSLSNIIWGEYLLIPILAFVGIYLTIGLTAMPWRKIPLAMKILWQGQDEKKNKKAISARFRH